MANSRRKFLKYNALFALGYPFVGASLTACSTTPQENITSESLKILILGGTSFLGPHQIYRALANGHEVSIFTRGKTLPTVHQNQFDQVEHLIGDRADNLTALENRSWDVVIDNSGHNVEWTKKSAELLKDKVGLYVFTSSTGVYYPYLGEDIDESTELLKEEPAELEDEDLKMEYWYGVMKTNSEIETIKAFGPERSLIIRPTYMIGPGDKSDRFIYWPIRLAKGGEIMVPGTKDPVQYIDVRDVADWTISLIEQKQSGAFNAVGPENKETMLEFVQKAQKAFEVESTLVPIDDYDFLKANNVPYLIPWIMPEDNNYGTARINNDKAKAAGLSFRAIENSVKDIHDWWYSDSLTDERRNEFEQKENSVLLREQDILEQWKQLTAD